MFTAVMREFSKEVMRLLMCADPAIDWYEGTW